MSKKIQIKRSPKQSKLKPAKKKATAAELTLKPVLSLVEAAEYLQVSYPTFQKVLNSGEIPFRRVGGRGYILRAVLDQWLLCVPVTGKVTGETTVNDITISH